MGLTGLPGTSCCSRQKSKKMLQRIEPPVDGRPRAALLMLVLHKLVHLTKRHLGEGDRSRGKKYVEIEGITRDGMHRKLPALEVCPKPIDGGLADSVHTLPLVEPLTLGDLAHGLVVLGAFGAVIELRIAQRHVEGAMAHQLFDDLQGRARIEELRSKRMPQRMGRIGLTDACQLQVAGHAVLY